MRAMRRHLFRNDLDHWATSFFDALRSQAHGQPTGREAGRDAARCARRPRRGAGMSAVPADLDAALRGAGRPAAAAGGQRLRRRARPAARRPVGGRPRGRGRPRCSPGWPPVDGVTVALVSGRGVADLQTTSGLSGPFRWVGSHGAEFDGPLTGELADRRDALAERLAPLVAGRRRRRLEVKPASVAVHVRQVADRAGGRRACWSEARARGGFVTDVEAGQGRARDRGDRRRQGQRPPAAGRRARRRRPRSTSGTTSPTRTASAPCGADDVTVKVGDGRDRGPAPGPGHRGRRRRPGAAGRPARLTGSPRRGVSAPRRGDRPVPSCR